MEYLKNYISNVYPTIDPYIGVNCIDKILKGRSYAVVSDHLNPCYGILTPIDLIDHPHKLVIDCMSPKDVVLMSDPYPIIQEKFKQSKSEALPVYQDEQFIGILEVTQMWGILNKLMEEYKNDVEKYGELKTSLLHNLYHEIRTPLNHIQGFMGILAEMDEVDLNTNYVQYSHIIQHGTKRFLQFMNNLIELSRQESDETSELYAEAIRIENLFIDLKSQYKEKYPDKNDDTLRYEKPARDQVVTDYARLKQVLSILIDISVFHSKEKCTILIGCNDISELEMLRFYIKNETAIVNDWQSKVILNSVEGFYRHDEIENFGFQVEVIKMISTLMKGTFEVTVEQGNVIASLTIPYTL